MTDQQLLLRIIIFCGWVLFVAYLLLQVRLA